MKKISTLIAAIVISISAFAQWDTLTINTITNFNSICFRNEMVGVAAGFDPITSTGNIFYTYDGGQNWNLAESGIHSKNDICFSNQALGWIAADSGYIMKSTGGGSFWYPLIQLGIKNFYSVYFPTDSTGYIGGEDGVLYKTMDAGVTWDTLNSGTTLSINDIYFSDALNGWIVGDGGYMAATADGGQTWTTVAQPYLGFFHCNGFAYVGTTAGAFAVGNSGDLIHSTDGGLNWSTFASNTTNNLNSVRFTNDLAGIICGDNGLIYRTQDGGNSWSVETMAGVTNNLTGIAWASDTVAYICGSNGRILKSHNDISAVHPMIRNTMGISAYPNPFVDVLNIAIELEKTSAVQISIMDVSGRILLVENEGMLNEGKQTISLQGISSLSSGMYFVKVISENGEMVIPVMKR